MYQKTKKNEHPKVFVFRCSAMLDFRPHPYRMRPEIKGLSHGLKNSPPDCFSPRLRRGRPFESHPAYKKNRYPGWDNGFSGTPEGTRLHCRPGMDGNEGVMPVEPGMSNSPPDCCIEIFEYKNKKERTPEGVRSGTPEGTRTPDLLIRSQSLYPTELPAHFALLS